MNERLPFNRLQAQEVAGAFNAAGVDYLAHDGIESFAEAKARAHHEDIFAIANLRDIIASKKASGRMKDRLDLHLLELFRLGYENRQA